MPDIWFGHLTEKFGDPLIYTIQEQEMLKPELKHANYALQQKGMNLDLTCFTTLQLQVKYET